jgi:hypothetical protein
VVYLLLDLADEVAQLGVGLPGFQLTNLLFQFGVRFFTLRKLGFMLTKKLPMLLCKFAFHLLQSVHVLFFQAIHIKRVLFMEVLYRLIMLVLRRVNFVAQTFIDVFHHNTLV